METARVGSIRAKAAAPKKKGAKTETGGKKEPSEKHLCERFEEIPSFLNQVSGTKNRNVMPQNE